MPRKTVKTEKPPLLFLERPVCGARLQNVPEVRAADNPKGFFSEPQVHNNTTLTSWVRPQFDTSVTAAPPVRRGRRRCHSATSILNNGSQLSKKNSVCKFPSLSFETRSRDQARQPGRTCRKKAAVEPDAGSRSPGSCRLKSAVSSTECLDTPKRQSAASSGKRDVVTFCDGAASSSRCLDDSPPVRVTGRCSNPADGTSTPASFTADVSSVCTPPDVDTPKAIQEGSSCPSSPSLHLLLAQSSSPPCSEPLDILVADTPERDYGMKVTWRRRRGLMLLLKERGQLSDSDVQIPS